MNFFDGTRQNVQLYSTGSPSDRNSLFILFFHCAFLLPLFFWRQAGVRLRAWAALGPEGRREREGKGRQGRDPLSP